jgi:hypothetical protein
VARIAQALGLHDRVPGTTEDINPPYEVLVNHAQTNERGWNTLCAEIINAIEELEKDYEAKIG